MPPPPEEAARWFKEEVHAHDGPLRAYLRGAYPTVRDIDDVVQESYLRVWRAKALQPIASVRAFLYQVARHVAVDLIRHEHAAPYDTVTDLDGLRVYDERPDAAEAACMREEIALLADAIAELPARCREIFILRKIRRIPQKEIAARLGISEQTVHVQVQRGMRRCERFLSERGL